MKADSIASEMVPDEIAPPAPKSRSSHVELVIVVAVTLGLVWTCWLAWLRMRDAGVIGNFSVLFTPTSWDLSSGILPHHPSYPYWKTLLVAYGNSMLVAVPVILLSTVIGVMVGVARVSGNLALSALARSFVDIFRNVPVILQISFWYMFLLNAPRAADAFSLGDLVFLSNRGLAFPAPILNYVTLWMLVAGIALFVAVPFLGRSAQGRGSPNTILNRRNLAIAGGVLILAVLAFSSWEVPQRRGFAFRGGGMVSIEFTALVLGLTIYGAAFIAEIVRGSLNSVPLGQIEAAKSLGLKPWSTFWKVRVPLSLRMMILPLSNQYLFLIKGTGLGLAVGFAEAFQVTVTSINQTGKSIDFLVIMMVAFIVINVAVSRTASAYNDRIALKYNGR